MGAKFDGFSIREYTSKMRSIDVFKCWPFTSTINREVTREELQSWLPPMTFCPRSNHQEVSRTDDGYCSQESENSDDFASPSPPRASAPPPQIDDDEKLEMICPVCREFNAATLTAVNAHIDGCLAQTVKEERRHMKMMNSKALKSKPPKKRSIAEIFKVEDDESPPPPPTTTPQVESVLKLCPLREDTDDEVSITVRKFHWLSQRLEALRSRRGGGESVKSGEGDSVEEEKLEMVCPVCRVFNAATVTAVNAHIDGCLAQAVREERRQAKRTGTVSKPKPKLPKKRSIAEILTVAPPIQASTSKGKAFEVDEEDKSSDYVGEDSGDEDNTVVSTIKNKKSSNKDKRKKNTKNAKNTKKKKSKLETHDNSRTGVYLSNEKKTIVSKKKKKKKKNIFNNELTGKKESAYKHMVQTTVKNSRKLQGTIGNKMVALQDMDPSFHRKKLGLNGLSAGKMQKVSNCDSVGMQAVSPVRSIVKNHIKHVSGKTSNGRNIRKVTEESHEKNQMLSSDRYVKFSRKDNIVSPDKRDSFDEPMFSMSSDTLATSSEKEQSSESDEETASFEAKRNYDHFVIDIDEDKRKEVYPLIESKQFSGTLDQVTEQTFLKPCVNQEKFMHLEQKPESLTKISVYDNINNSQLFDGDKTTTLHFSPYSDISKPLSAVQEGLGSGIDTQVCESGVFSSSGKFNDYSEDPNFHVDAMNKSPNTKTFLEPSSSVSVPCNKVNETPESPLHTYGDNDNNGQALGDRQLTNMFPTDMIDKSYPFTGWGKGTGRNTYLDPYFFGWPLNSHGELINFCSSGKEGMNQPEASSPSLQGSVSGLPINNTLRQSSQESVSINERHVVQQTLPKDGLNSFPHYPPRLAVTKVCSGREDIHLPNSDMRSSYYAQPLSSKFHKQNSRIEQSHCDRVQNQNGIGMVSLKESSDHISPGSSQPTVRLMGKDVPIGRSSQEMHQFTSDVWTDEESRRRNYAEYAPLKNSLLGKCSKQQWVCGSPLQISTECVMQSAKIQSTQGPQSTSGFPQQFTDPRSNHVSHNGSLGVGRNVSSYSSPSIQEPTSYAVFNGGVPDHFQEQFIAGTKPLGLISRPQVLPTPCNYSQPTCSRNGELNDRNKNPHVAKSAFGFPFLQPAVNEQAKTSWSQSPYRSSSSWLSSSTDEMPTGKFSQQLSGMGNQSFPQNRWGNNFITPSGNHSAEVLFPSNPMTSREPMKSTPLCPGSIVQPPQVSVTRPSTINSDHRNMNNVFDRVVIGHHPCTNTRNRPAANFDDSSKPIKLSNIQVKENLNGMTRLAGENSSVELQRNKRAVVLDPQVDHARSRCCQNVTQNVNPTSYPAVDSSPIRFGPKRAKHILKSS